MAVAGDAIVLINAICNDDDSEFDCWISKFAYDDEVTRRKQ
jgi:hypothetical protein